MNIFRVHGSKKADRGTAFYDMIVNMWMKKYADDYETIVTTDENGKKKETLVYRGVYYEISLDEPGLVRFKRLSLLCLVVIIGLHVSAGFVNNRGMYQIFVALPYVAALFPLLYMVESAFRLPKVKRKYRRDEIGRSFERLKTLSFVLLTFLGVGVLGEIVFLLFVSKINQPNPDYLFLTLEGLAAAVAYFFTRLQKNIQILVSSEEPQT